MSIPSWLLSPFLSCNDVMNNFDVESISSNSNPFLSTQHSFLSSYNTDHHAQIFNFFDPCNCGTPAGLPNPPLMSTFCNSSNPTDGQSRLPAAAPTDKKNHKMIEKQRRKETKALFSTLRSLLPNENLGEKRTVSDQVLEAVNYVRHLQRKVQDLLAERGKMEANSDQNGKAAMEKSVSKCLPFGGSERDYPELKINSASSGVQICTNSLEHEIVYSDILLALEGGGLEVVSAASSKVNNRVYHTIHTQVLDLNTFNVDSLYHNLWHLIRPNHAQNQNQNQNLHTTEAGT